MKINVMSWNMAGAKVFDRLTGPPNPAANTYINHFHDAWAGESGILHHIHTHTNPPQDPDIILLQECIGFVDQRPHPSGRWQSGEEILKAIFFGYDCYFFPAFSSRTHPNPARWNKFRRGGDASHYIPDEIEAQQGYGVCVRDAGQLRRLWVDEIHGSGSHPDADRPQSLPQYNVCFEAIPTTTGLYLGSRDTEPRLVVLGRLKLSDKAARKRYMNFLNIHLTTLKGEREGNIRRDRLGSKKRLQQLNLILDDILSAYQETTAHRVPRNSISQEEDIWIMAGDFNATPNAEELELVGRVGFVDGNSDKKLWDATGQFHNRIGTKWSSSKSAAPPIVVDYIMCGLQDTAFPMDGVDTSNSLRPYRPLFPDGSAFEPDHAVLFASFEVRS